MGTHVSAAYTSIYGLPTLAQEPRNPAIEQLSGATVSRLEWGLEKLEQSPDQHFSIDPLSLEPSSPPHFVNVSWDPDDQQISIGMGRTFPAINDEQATQS